MREKARNKRNFFSDGRGQQKEGKEKEQREPSAEQQQEKHPYKGKYIDYSG